MLQTYEDLVNACLTSDRPVHLLYFFMRVETMPSEEDREALFPDQDLAGLESMCSLLFDAHEPVKPDLSFARLVAKGDSVNPDWNMVMVMTMRSTENQPPTVEQGQEALAKLRVRFASGDIPPGVPVFDRDGNARGIGKSVPLGGPGQIVN